MTSHANHRITLLSSATLALCLSSAHAASPNVDAGALLRQTEQELKTTPKTAKRKPRQATPITPATPSEATVQVRRFQFTGNRLLSTEALNTALVSFTNRPLTLGQLKDAADAITNTYREAGWTVRAFVPKQEINDGVVTLQIVEAVFGNAAVQGNAPERVEAARLVRMAEALLPQGQPIHASQIDRALLLLDDLPGVSVAGNLVEGERDGETNLLIAAVDDALINGNASIDNQGSRATGIQRFSTNINLNSPLQLGDALGINSLKTHGSEYHRVGYSLPVGYTGWRAGVHASNLNYQVIEGFAGLNAHGTATTQGVDLTYPLLRSQMQNMNFAFGYDNKKFDNYPATDQSAYGIKVYNATLSANQTDQWQGGGITNASITLTAGNKSTDTRYNKTNLSLSRLQTLGDTTSAYAAINTQRTNRNLDSSEKMYLGGATGVRAYPSSEAGGSDAHTFTLELRQRLAYNVTLTGFYDFGWVKPNHDNNVLPSSKPSNYHLQSYGASLTWQATQTVDFKATLAQRIGSNPNADTNTGMDGDGTKKVTRLWLSSGIAF